ncbi:AraC family transcriptional regulator [Olivibacter sitiensis]|uniref:AraC family transcriptional regulator n=1 Tax=Olivibacter sitiensis TaxID=376470 RepID=UPI000484BC3F|nr:helix-turn-helix domain-containing protein [Olivibacter sitiensis]
MKRMHTFPEQKLLRSEDILLLDMSKHRHQLSAVPHRHDHYTIMWVQQEASSTQSIDGNSYEMHPHRIFFMAPGQIHVMDGKPQQGWLLLFSEAMFQYFLNSHPSKETIGITTPLINKPFVDLPKQERDLFAFIFQYLYRNLQKKQMTFSLAFHQLSLLLLKLNAIHLQQQHQLGPPKLETKLYLQLTQLIERYFRIEHDTNFYATALLRHPKTINNMLKRSAGSSIVQMLHERICAEAKTLLITSELSIKEISYSLGFKDPSYFNRFFKRIVSITPLDFRTKHHHNS